MAGNERARRLVEALLAARGAERAAQVRQLVVISDLVDAYDTIDPSTLPGAERLVPSGAEGTPLVAEFIAAELGPLLQESIPTTWSLIRDVMNLRERHPLLWKAVLAQRVPPWQARRVAAQCSHLGLEACRWVDARLGTTWGHATWGRVQRMVRGLIPAADGALARARAEARRRERFVHVRHEGEGVSLVVARLDTPDAVALRDAVEEMARGMVIDGRTAPLPILRAEALGALATPTGTGDGSADGERSSGGRLPRAAATLVVHVARETLHDPASGVARSDDVGPLLLDEVVKTLGHRRVHLLPVIDLAGDPGGESYEIPAHVSRHVRVRDPFSGFPWSNSASGDLDHTSAFTVPGPPRQSRASNLAPLSRREHRSKTHGGMRASHPAPGILEWESPLGYRYRVRNGRSRRITDDQVLPWDRTGRCHFYPPPDDTAITVDVEFRRRE